MAEYLIITGLSGAGRSQAGATLEDLSWFVIDNLPTALIVKVAELAAVPGSLTERVALVVGRDADHHLRRRSVKIATGTPGCRLAGLSKGSRRFGISGRHGFLGTRCLASADARRDGAVGSAAIIVSMRVPASRMRPSIIVASGKFFQYFFGISFCIASILSRAGLKIDA